MNIEQTTLDGVLILTPARFGDDRGWFSETWNAQRMAAAGLDMAFVQDNHSMSGPVGTLRGLHYQSPPHAQDKLVPVSYTHLDVYKRQGHEGRRIPRGRGR